MNIAVDTAQECNDRLQGLGCSRKRVEYARFTQGHSNYVDDIKLPGILFGDFVRSSYGHARIKSIDTSAALALNGVLAVLTAADLKPLNLHCMPILAGDVQAVLADEKLLFQGQEVAFVIARSRYIAADAIELIQVDYEPLPALVDPFKAMAEDAPVLREDIADKMQGSHGPRRHANHVFLWEQGDKAATEQALSRADVTCEELISYQRAHACPLETCGCVASAGIKIGAIGPEEIALSVVAEIVRFKRHYRNAPLQHSRASGAQSMPGTKPVTAPDDALERAASQPPRTSTQSSTRRPA